MYSLDYIYTKSYYLDTSRNKISWIKSEDFPDSLDYVLLGSSRCVHHLQPQIVNEKTKLNGLNLGYAACGPIEIKLMLKELLKKTKVKKVFVQVDQSYDYDKPDNLAIVAWLPFIKEQDVYNELKKYGNPYNYYRYIPFYRYQKKDPKIGFREVVLKYLGKKAKSVANYGYKPINRNLQKDEVYNYSFKNKENLIYKEIISICKSKKIEVYFFTTPIYKNEANFSILSNFLPQYKDFSNSFVQKSLFADGTHLNHDGSTEFTNLFIDYYFEKSEN